MIVKEKLVAFQGKKSVIYQETFLAGMKPASEMEVGTLTSIESGKLNVGGKKQTQNSWWTQTVY
jgi:hypothetical protein